MENNKDDTCILIALQILLTNDHIQVFFVTQSAFQHYKEGGGASFPNNKYSGGGGGALCLPEKGKKGLMIVLM